MPQINLTDFSGQQADLQRQLRMADLLQQQAAAPIEIQSYKGIQAPIPWTATLAKVLGSYAAAKKDRDIGKKDTDLKAAMLAQRMEALKAYNTPTVSTLQEAPRLPNPGMAQALGSPPPAAPPQAQAMAAALGGAPAPAATPMPMPAPMPAPVEQPPAGVPAGMPPPATPNLATSFVQPTPLAPPVTPPPTERAVTAAERQDMALQMMGSTDPALQQMGSQFYAETVKQAKTERLSKAIAGADLGGANPTLVRFYLDAEDPAGAVDYISQFGMKKLEAEATIAAIKQRAEETAEERSRQREFQGEQNRLQRELIAANAQQASADRQQIAFMNLQGRREAAALAQMNRPGKVMPANKGDALSFAGEALDTSERLKQGFQDRFAGRGTFGRAQLEVAKRFDPKDPAVNWWQDYDRHNAYVRQKLFGSALTKTEAPNWERLVVTPEMSPAQAKRNLAGREVIERRVAAKLGKAYIADGYGEDVIDAYLGRSIRELDIGPPPTPAQMGYGGGAGKDTPVDDAAADAVLRRLGIKR